MKAQHPKKQGKKRGAIPKRVAGEHLPTIGEFRKQRRNANKHTERGLKLLSESVDRDGWIGALTVAADGETFDGSARLVTAQQDSRLEPIVVDSDGSRPVIVRRTDIATADDPKAKRLGVMANHVTATDWEPDAAVLAEIAKDDAVIAALANEDARLAELLRQPKVLGWGEAAGRLPDNDRAPFQQMTFTLHDSQVERVKQALGVARGKGAFDSPNENGNGNALARICETYITQNANG